MKKSIAWMCAALAAVCFSGAASAEMFKCTKDGKTTYQEQPCEGQGVAEKKMESSRPSAWVGCYQIAHRGFDSGSKQIDDVEIRQEGNTLFTAPSKNDKEELRMIMRPASPEDLLALKEKFLTPNGFKGEVLSGLAMYGVAANWGDVKPTSGNLGVRVGLYWVSPAGEEKGLYFFGPFAFAKTTKVACTVKK